MSASYFDDNVKPIDRINYLELTLNECGREKCSPLKRINSYAKGWHVFHYIVSGKGTFVLEDRGIYILRLCTWEFLFPVLKCSL